jgi:hypothetical protein
VEDTDNKPWAIITPIKVTQEFYTDDDGVTRHVDVTQGGEILIASNNPVVIDRHITLTPTNDLYNN